MAIRGVFQSHYGLLGERVTDISARVLRTGPGGTAPLLALTSGMPKESAINTSFSWIEDEHISGNAVVETGGNSAAVTIVVDDANIWTKNAIVMNEATGEYFVVSAVAADSKTVTIARRGFGGTTAATITAGDTIQLISTAWPEGSGKPEPVTQKGEDRLNYVQIFKDGWSITGTAKAVKWITGNQMAQNRELCFAYHAEAIERAFWWGRKAVIQTSEGQLRTMNGVLPQIEQYGGLVRSAASDGVAGRLNLKDLMNFMRLLFDVNAKGFPNERIAFCGSQLVELLQQMVMLDTMYTITADENTFGLQVFTVKGFNGTLKLVIHPLMVENVLWQRQLYVIHPGLIKKRILRETWTQEFTQGANTNAGIDADEGFIADEMGIEVRGVKTMGIYKNIQTAGASY